MDKIISSKDFIHAILESADNRYIVLQEGLFHTSILETAPIELSDKAVVRLRRTTSATASWRTILVVVLESEVQVKLALRWAAATKDELVEPETGDLYLFAAVRNSSLSLEQCTSIEASEQFCRKYFLRPEESLKELICRTFLAPVNSSNVGEEIEDPLQAALRLAAKDSSWFTAEKQVEWRNAFVSGRNGMDLIDIIFED